MAFFHMLRAQGLKADTVKPAVGLRLYHAVISKLLFYGIELLPPDNKLLAALDKAQAKILRSLLGMHPLTPTRWVLWEAGCLSAERVLIVSTLKYWRRIKTRKCDRRSQLELVLSSLAEEGLVSQLEQRVLKFALAWDLPEVQFDYLPGKQTWKVKVNEIALQKEEESFNTWAKSNVEAQRYNYLLLKPNFAPDTCIMSLANWEMISVVLRARAGTTSLADKLEFENQPPCALCKNKHQGILPHYLLECSWGPFLRLRKANEKLLNALLPEDLRKTFQSDSSTVGIKLRAILGSGLNWESEDLRRSVLQLTAKQLIELNMFRPR
jgi:hypothetical protein